LAQIFLTQLAIRWLFKFPLHLTSVSTLPGEIRTNEICIKMKTNVNKLEIILSATKCRPMILVSRNIKYVQIFAGVPSARGRRRQVQYA